MNIGFYCTIVDIASCIFLNIAGKAETEEYAHSVRYRETGDLRKGLRDRSTQSGTIGKLNTVRK